VDDMKTINLDRCIGCGLCVSTCEDNAMSLSRKSADELYEPPKSTDEKLARIAQERGKI
jgi:electron transport complex protein RnfB